MLTRWVALLFAGAALALTVPPLCDSLPGTFVEEQSKQPVLDVRDDAPVTAFELNPNSFVYSVDSSLADNFKALFTEKFAEKPFPLYAALMNETIDAELPLTGVFAPQNIGEVTVTTTEVLKPGPVDLLFGRGLPNILTGPLNEISRIFRADQYVRLESYNFSATVNKVITIGDIVAQHLRSLASVDEHDGEGIPDAARWLYSLNKVTLKSILKTYVDPIAEFGETGEYLHRILILLNSVLVSISSNFTINTPGPYPEVTAGVFDAGERPLMAEAEAATAKQLMVEFLDALLGSQRERVAEILRVLTTQHMDRPAFSSLLLSISDLLSSVNLSPTIRVGMTAVAMSDNPVQAMVSLVSGDPAAKVEVDSTAFMGYWEKLRTAESSEAAAVAAIDGLSDLLVGFANATQTDILQVIQRTISLICAVPLNSISQFVTDVIAILLDQFQVPLLIQSAPVNIIAWTRQIVDLIQGPWSMFVTLATADKPIGIALGFIDSLLVNFDVIRTAQDAIANVLEQAAEPLYEVLTALSIFIESPEPLGIIRTLLRRFFPDYSEYRLPWPEWARETGMKMTTLANIYEKAKNCLVPNISSEEEGAFVGDDTSLVMGDRLMCVGTTLGDFVDFIQQLVPPENQVEFQQALRAAGQAVYDAYQYILPITRGLAQFIDPENPNSLLALTRFVFETLGGYSVITDGVTQLLQTINASPIFLWTNLAVQALGSLLDILAIPELEPVMPYVHGVQNAFVVIDTSAKWIDLSLQTQKWAERLAEWTDVTGPLQEGRDMLYYPVSVAIGIINDVFLQFNKVAVRGELGPLFTLTFNSIIQLVLMHPEAMRLLILTDITDVVKTALFYTFLPQGADRYVGDLIPAIGELLQTDDVFYSVLNVTYTVSQLVLYLDDLGQAGEGGTGVPGEDDLEGEPDLPNVLPGIQLPPEVRQALETISTKTYAALINTLDPYYLRALIDIVAEVADVSDLNALIAHYMAVYVRPFAGFLAVPDNVYVFIDYLRRESNVQAFVLNGRRLLPVDFNQALIGKRGALTAQLYALPSGPQVYPVPPTLDRGFWLIVGGSLYGLADVCHFVLEERAVPISSRPGTDAPLRLFATQRECFPLAVFHNPDRQLPELWPLDRAAGFTGEFVKGAPERPSILITHGNQAMGILDYEDIQQIWTFRQTTLDIFVASTDFIISTEVSERMNPLVRGGGFQTYGFYAQLVEGKLALTADHVGDLCQVRPADGTKNARPYRRDIAVALTLEPLTPYSEIAATPLSVLYVPFSVPPFSDSCREGSYLDNSGICQDCNALSIFQYCNEARPAETRLAQCPPTSVCANGVARMCDPQQHEFKPSALSPFCIACPSIAVVNTASRCEFCSLDSFKDVDNVCTPCSDLLNRAGSWYCKTNSVPLTSMSWSEPIRCEGTVSADGMRCELDQRGDTGKSDNVDTGLPIGAIVGIVIGVVAFLAIVACVTVFAVRKLRKTPPKEPLRSPVPTTK